MINAQRVRFVDIDPSVLRHPLDRMATEQLKKVRFFDTLATKFLEFGVEPFQRALNDANNVKVGPTQIPKLYHMLREGCAILDMPEPDLYLSQKLEVNASTFGHVRPYITLNSGLLDLMDEEEVMAVIAHELGHVKCGHVLYTMMAAEIDVVISGVASAIPTIGQFIEKGLQFTIVKAFTTWKRRAELTCDRAALLVMQDPRPCISMLAKLAGGTTKEGYQLNPEEFLNQACIYKEEGDQGANRIYRSLINTNKGTHPFAVERAHYLNEWIDSSEYDQILQGNYRRIPRQILPRPVPPFQLGPMPPPFQQGPVPVLQIAQEQARYCANCRLPLNTTSKFCPRCGSAS